MESGILAGYPVVDVRIELVDGSFHDVDSSEMAFKVAGSMAFKEAMKRAKPKLLEPVMAVEVVTPGGVPRRRDGRPQLAPRARRGPGAARQRAGDQGARPARHDVRLRNRPALDDAGPGHVHHAVRSLRGSASVDRGRDRRRPERKRNRKGENGQAEVRADQAAPQRRHDRSHRPRQDDAHRRDHEGARGEGRQHDRQVVRGDRQRARGAAARHHDQHLARRVRDGEPPLRARRLPGSRRLHQEHDHGRRPDGRRDPGGLGRRRPDAADAGAHPARAPGRGAVHRRLPEQGRHGRRPRAARARRAGGPRAALQVRVPRRRHPDRDRLGAEGARGRRGGGRRRSSS